MTIGYAGAIATHGPARDGGARTTIRHPAAAAWGQFGATVTLRAGYDVIRLATRSPFAPAAGTGRDQAALGEPAGEAMVRPRLDVVLASPQARTGRCSRGGGAPGGGEP
jgi:hypothetical protein